MITVTRDSGANVKILKRLQDEGLVEVTDLLLENGRENKKINKKEPAIGVIGHSFIGECVIASDETPFDAVLELIGRNNVKDAMHLEAHIRLGNDYFVTEDTDFLKLREILNAKFGCKILTPQELSALFY